MISAVVLAVESEPTASEPRVFRSLQGKPLLQWVLESALAARLDEIVCVTSELRLIRKQMNLVDERLFWLAVTDRKPSASVVAGLWAIHPKSDGVLFLDGAQPLPRNDLIPTLVERFKETSAWIVAPAVHGKTREPVLFRRELFPELLELSGKRTLHSVLQKHRRDTVLIELPDETLAAPDMAANPERIKELA